MTKDRRPTDGARALRRWLREHEKSLCAFCLENGLDRVNTQKAVNGEKRRISVDFALAIELATEGSVDIRWWASNTMKSVDEHPKAA